MTEVMKGNLSMVELDEYKNYLGNATHEMAKRYQEKRNGVGIVPNGIIVSSNTKF